VNYGFVIDNRACIGCHACSTACKSENQVPLGVYRTWVRYTETGTFPDTQRHFQVTRCNHCANPPCVRICPTGAMFQRNDGIVEFDNTACIGCKACMQACPYDAIYIDPVSHTAAKCHYCAHRVEVGLEPSCAVVCPTHAIIAGDMDDPGSEIHRLLSREKVSVRKPEQGTAPKVFYIEGAAVNLVPTATERAPASYVWADVVQPLGLGGSTASTAGASRGAQHQGQPAGGPIHLAGRQAEHMVQVGYNAQHKVPWHWPVPAYLVTKAIGSGMFLVFALAVYLFGYRAGSSAAIATAATSLLAMLATTALLVGDLDRPARFLYILLRPQWRSWLARGALFLMGFSGLLTAWLALELLAATGTVHSQLAIQYRPMLLAIGTPLAVGTAIYTAFLFGQAEGRDLWQSPLLPLHLLTQCLLAGSAALLLGASVFDVGYSVQGVARAIFGLTLVVDLFMVLLGEFGMPHASEVAARAAHQITHGRHRYTFWYGAIALGHVVPLALLMVPYAVALPIAAVAAIQGLYAFEYVFVMAPQEVPNS